MNASTNITDHPDPRIAVAEMWLCMLGGLMDVSRRFSRFLVHEMTPFKTGAKGQVLALPFSGDPRAAFKRVVRIARFAAVLYLKIQTQIAAWKAGEPFDLDAFLAQTPLPSARLKMGGDCADSHEEEWEDLEEWEELEDFETLREREAPEWFDFLDGSARPVKEDKYQALLRGPLKDAIAAICKDLGIKPDWSLWTANGFPAPAGGGVEDWVAFFVPEVAAAATPADFRRGTTPLPLGDRDSAPRSAWPPPDPGATRPPDRGRLPDHPLGGTDTHGLTSAGMAPGR